MNKKAKRTIPPTVEATKAEESTAFLEEINSILADKTLSQSEKCDKVCSLVDERRARTKEKLAASAFDVLRRGPFSGVNVQENDISSAAENLWYQEQSTSISQEINLIDSELQSLAKRTEASHETVTNVLNEHRMFELEQIKRVLVQKLNNYQAKVSTRENECK